MLGLLSGMLLWSANGGKCPKNRDWDWDPQDGDGIKGVEIFLMAVLKCFIRERV